MVKSWERLSEAEFEWRRWQPGLLSWARASAASMVTPPGWAGRAGHSKALPDSGRPSAAGGWLRQAIAARATAARATAARCPSEQPLQHLRPYARPPVALHGRPCSDRWNSCALAQPAWQKDHSATRPSASAPEDLVSDLRGLFSGSVGRTAAAGFAPLGRNALGATAPEDPTVRSGDRCPSMGPADQVRPVSPGPLEESGISPRHDSES